MRTHGPAGSWFRTVAERKAWCVRKTDNCAVLAPFFPRCDAFPSHDVRRTHPKHSPSFARAGARVLTHGSCPHDSAFLILFTLFLHYACVDGLSNLVSSVFVDQLVFLVGVAHEKTIRTTEHFERAMATRLMNRTLAMSILHHTAHGLVLLVLVLFLPSSTLPRSTQPLPFPIFSLDETISRHFNRAKEDEGNAIATHVSSCFPLISQKQWTIPLVVQGLRSHHSQWSESIVDDEVDHAEYLSWTRSQPCISNQTLLRQSLIRVWFATPMPRASLNARKGKGRGLSVGIMCIAHCRMSRNERGRRCANHRVQCTILRHCQACNALASNETGIPLQVASAVHALQFRVQTTKSLPRRTLLFEAQTSFHLWSTVQTHNTERRTTFLGHDLHVETCPSCRPFPSFQRWI